MEVDSTSTVLEETASSKEKQEETMEARPISQMLAKVAQTSAETEEKIEKSNKTFHMIPTCLRYSIPLPINSNTYNHNDYNGYGPITDQLKYELAPQRKAIPCIVCFSDKRHKIPEGSTEKIVKMWRNSTRVYEETKIVYHFHGLARMCPPPTKRQPFAGIHYEAPVTTSSIIGRGVPSLRLGIGFVKPGEETLYIVGTSTWMYFEDDCLSFGVFDMDKKHASLHVSGWGWQQIEGTPIEKDK